MRATRPRALAYAAALVACLALAAACVQFGTPPPSTSTAPTTGGTRPTDSTGPVSPVVGIVIAVEPAAQASPAEPSPAGASPAKSPTRTPPGKTVPPSASSTFAPVTGFTLQTSGGETLTLKMGVLDDAADFPDYQLYDRLSSGDPILVFFNIVGSDLVVYHIEDAG